MHLNNTIYYYYIQDLCKTIPGPSFHILIHMLLRIRSNIRSYTNPFYFDVLRRRVEAKLFDGGSIRRGVGRTQHHSSWNFKHILLKAFSHIHTRMRVCIRIHRSGVVRFWSGPEARRQRASDVSLSRPHSVAMQLESVNRDPHPTQQKPRARLSWRQSVNGREEYPQTTEERRRRKKKRTSTGDWRQERNEKRRRRA